jgi:Phospholipase B
MRRALVVALVAMTTAVLVALSSSSADPRMKGAFRRTPQNGWTYVHLEGRPAEIGFQHGYLLAEEIADLQQVFALELKHDTGKDWQFYRDASEHLLWPHIEEEYRDELRGIAEGVAARSVRLDVWDIVAMNAALEWSYYSTQYDKQHPPTSAARTPGVAERCSAFVATGSYTKDGRIVIGHNNWTQYLDGARWTMAFDIQPAGGYRLVMDGLPGLIHSADDFGVNAAGMAITETTISEFFGYDTTGIPEFVRSRKAMQYATSIDDAATIFKTGNNGGYANDWLIADTRRNEIASLELGLKHVTLERKTDGYFVGANFPIDPTLTKEETTFDVHDMSLSPNARHRRWDQLMAKHKGAIDLSLAHAFLSDHVDTYTGRTEPSERTLCGHIDRSSRGMGKWLPPYGVGGTAQNKAADAGLIAKMSFTAAAGHACGIEFKAADHLARHPEFAWQKPLLRDLPSRPWTTIVAE